MVFFYFYTYSNKQWNNHGYDVAKIFGSKFDMISPVWLQVLRKGQNVYELGGGHDIDVEWIRDVRRGGAKQLKSNESNI